MAPHWRGSVSQPNDAVGPDRVSQAKLWAAKRQLTPDGGRSVLRKAVGADRGIAEDMARDARARHAEARDAHTAAYLAAFRGEASSSDDHAARDDWASAQENWKRASVEARLAEAAALTAAYAAEEAGEGLPVVAHQFYSQPPPPPPARRAV